ncbi:MAG: hypothetical protein LC796_06360 [Acidobacteria bacterium]|nr:hypothetical protein [Acidobacteriota bacterium]MCA1612154.1 hypothetical protein [Acidobacteriota bacterium]
MTESEDRLRKLESEIERRLLERFAGLRDEFERLRLESDRRWEGFLSRFDQDFTGLVPPELVAIPEPEAPAPAPSDLPDRPTGAGLLSIEVARNLDDAGNQVEALHRFLELCRRHASRAALLISKSGSFAVWKATGFSDHGGNDEAARRVAFPMEDGPLARVLEGSAFRLPTGNEISARLGALDASSAVLVPMVVKEKVSGAVYADCTADEASRFDPESIAFLTFLAGLFVDRLAGRKLKPAPAMRAVEDFRPPAGERAPSASAEGAASPERPVSTEAGGAAEAMSAPEPPAESSRPPARESFGTQVLRFGASPPPARPEPAPAAPEPPSPSEPEFAEPDVESPSTAPPAPGAGDMRAKEEPEPSLAYEADEEPAPDPEPPVALRQPPPSPEPPPRPPVTPKPDAPPAPASSAFQPAGGGGRRLAGPLAPADGDERRDEARRFAKLLVSEIKLYNEKAVLEGRQHGDLYPRLKEDIDRSRQMYDERIPEDVRSSSNFFYEELVRILAEGRAESLGL